MTRRAVGPVIVFLFVSLCFSRVFAVSQFYNTHRNLYVFLSHNEQEKMSVCVGDEWYRFPGHFFLPDHGKLVFLQGGFHGLLPGYFNSTDSVAGQVNYMNREEIDRYESHENGFEVRATETAVITLLVF